MKNKQKKILICGIAVLIAFVIMLFARNLLANKSSIIMPKEANEIISSINNYIRNNANKLKSKEKEWLAFSNNLSVEDHNIHILGTSGFYIDYSNWIFLKIDDKLIGVCDNNKTIAKVLLKQKNGKWIIIDYSLLYRNIGAQENTTKTSEADAYN